MSLDLFLFYLWVPSLNNSVFIHKKKALFPSDIARGIELIFHIIIRKSLIIIL